MEMMTRHEFARETVKTVGLTSVRPATSLKRGVNENGCFFVG
jgi:hypothetical protein